MLKNYKIKEGKHYAQGLNFGLVFKRNKERSVIFGDNCWYSDRDKSLNKLFGFSFGFFHHNNSIRFAWRPNFERAGFIKIYSYTYNKGVRNMKYICDVETSTQHRYLISVTGKTLFMQVSGMESDESMITNYDAPFSLFGFKLYPYFGGKGVAMHLMNMFFNRSV